MQAQAGKIEQDNCHDRHTCLQGIISWNIFTMLLPVEAIEHLNSNVWFTVRPSRENFCWTFPKMLEKKLCYSH